MLTATLSPARALLAVAMSAALHLVSPFSGAVAEAAPASSRPDASALTTPWSAVAMDDTARVRRWRGDLRGVVERITTTHPRPFAFAPRAAFDSAAAAIEARIPRTPDAVLAVEVMRMVALLGDGHTMVIGTLPGLGFTSVLPLWLRPCEDGLYVGAAGPALAGLVGSRVVSIAGQPVDRALEGVLSMTSGDNRYTRLDRAPLFLMMPMALHALGIGDAADRITLGVERAAGRTEQITAVGGPPPPGFPEAFLETEPRFPDDWTRARRVPSDGAARCDLRPDDAWWFEYLPKPRVMYLRLRRIDPVSGGESYAAFYRRLFTAIDSLRPAALAIDLRHDHGGNNTIVDRLIRGLVQRPWLDREGALFALVDRGTFSAAMNAAVFLEDRTEVTFVGEPTGSRVNHYGDAPERSTPGFGMMFQVSTLPWMSRSPSDPRVWIAPSLATPSTFATWREGGDPGLDAVLDAVSHGTLKQRVLLAARTGGEDSVATACEAWTRRHPNPWDASGGLDLRALAERLSDQGLAGEAVTVSGGWSRIEPSSPYAWLVLAQSCVQAGDRARAVASLRRVLQLRPDAAYARRMLTSLGEKP